MADIDLSKITGIPLGKENAIFAADDGSGDVFGPNGVPVPNNAAATSYISRDFSFPTAKSDDDLYLLEFSNGNGWSASSGFPFLAGQSGYYFGARHLWTSTTVCRIEFGIGGYTPTGGLGAVGASWSSLNGAGWRYRLRKASSGALVGAEMVNSINPGISPQRTDFIDVSSYVTPSGSAALNSLVKNCQAQAYSDSTGKWRVVFNFDFNFTSVALTNFTVAWSGVTSGTLTQALTAATTGAVSNPRAIMNPSSSTIVISVNTTPTGVHVSGDIALASKPTWA